MCSKNEESWVELENVRKKRPCNCGPPEDLSVQQEGDHVVVSGVPNVLKFDTTCMVGDNEVECFDEDGKMKCKLPQVYPDYEGDVVFQVRQRGRPLITTNTNSIRPGVARTQVPEQERCLLFRTRTRELYEKLQQYVLPWQCLAEFFGTMLMIVIGCGTVASAVLTGAQVGIWQVAIVWGLGVALSIYATAAVSGAHLNPAVSFAFCIFRRKQFPWYKLLPYILAQLLGAMCGAALNLGMFDSQYDFVLESRNTTRGSGDFYSIATASTFGEYYPNPGFTDIVGPVSTFQALAIEAFGSGILMFLILAITDNRNKAVRNKDFAPLLIGSTVAVLISVYAPYTQAGWNPARDFGPRLIACMAGWGKDAIPGPNNGFWIYILGPFIGTVVGAAVYDLFISPGLNVLGHARAEADK